MTPNPPIKGHELLMEGHTRRRHTISGYMDTGDPTKDYSGGCYCGAKPEGFPLSIGAMKRWHRQHKADLRAAS